MLENTKDNTKQIDIDLKSFKSAWDILKKSFSGFFGFLKNKKNDSVVMLLIAILFLWLAGYFVYQLYGDISYLNSKTPQLINLTSYDFSQLKESDYKKNLTSNFDTIYDLIKENTSLKDETIRNVQYLDSLQLPYVNFLQYIYLPRLNIWKDAYTNKINTNLIGIDFLKNNPYEDIALFQKRSDFFKNVWDNNESNEISNIQIWDIIEDQNWFFYIPVSVSFVANSKRSFLLLVDKLSMTSNKENISLINEFFYYLWQEIKKTKSNEIKSLKQEYLNIFWSWDVLDDDKVIWYGLYSWMFKNWKNTLITADIIKNTVKSVVSCNNNWDEICYYKFREKYRDIPTFGYLVGTDFSVDPVQNLKDFVTGLPPVFSMKAFSFDKLRWQEYSDTKNIKYQWNITINVYGKWISQWEIQEMSETLWEKCFTDDQVLSIQSALNLINKKITDLSNLNRFDKWESNSLWQVKSIVDKINLEYPKLTNYKKIIKLFEIYRTISNAGLCK